MSKALIIGRFQPFHKGHLYLINQALKENDSVIIAIGSSQESRTFNNPLTFLERKKIILSCIPKIRIIPCPDFKKDNDWANYLIKKAKFNVIYSNNDWVKSIFLKRKIIVKGAKKMKGISATKIRKMIKKGDLSYKKLIPKNSLKILNSLKFSEIIKNL